MKKRSVQPKNTWRITWRFEDLTRMWWCLCKKSMIWVEWSAIITRRINYTYQEWKNTWWSALGSRIREKSLREKLELDHWWNESNWKKNEERGDFSNLWPIVWLEKGGKSTMKWLGKGWWGIVTWSGYGSGCLCHRIKESQHSTSCTSPTLLDKVLSLKMW